MWEHPESHPGAYLQSRFMEPLDLSAAALATGCRMPRSRVSDLLAGKRRISADTAQRLGAFFRMEPRDWLALQASWDLSQTPSDTAIVPLDPAGFLLGPLGATPVPTLRPRRPTLIAPANHLSGLLAAESGTPYGSTTHREVRYSDGTRALVAESDGSEG